MSQYLLDTNILLRSVDTSSDQHPLATDCVYQLLKDGNECLLLRGQGLEILRGDR